MVQKRLRFQALDVGQASQCLPDRYERAKCVAFAEKTSVLFVAMRAMWKFKDWRSETFMQPDHKEPLPDGWCSEIAGG
jgi:hypothetical protein